MRECNSCHESKTLDDFAWRNKAGGIRANKCKACQRKYSSTHYQNNKSTYREAKNRNWPSLYAKGKQYIYDYLSSHPCVDCGNSDIRVLQFDHRESVGGKAKRVTHFAASLGRLIEEIAKCDVRCANCHMIRTGEQFGWSRQSGR